MSIKSEITRIQNNVAASLIALQEKGVSVPSSATSDSLPGLISQVSGGAAEVEEATNAAGGKTVYINSEPEKLPELPDGFARLEWIQGSGSQYIKTGYTPNSNTRVVLDAYNLSAGSGWTFGAWTSSSSLQYAFSCNASYSFRYGSTGVSLASVPVGSLKVDFNKNAYNLNGTAGTLTAASFTCAYPMYLFAINAAGSVSSGKFTGQVMSCQIYDNGTLVRDYVPCTNESGAAGLYDFVTRAFFGDAAGVGFVAGPVVNPGVSKVVLEDEVLIDLTGDTVTPESLLSGFTAHNAMGQLIQGAAKSGRTFATGTMTGNGAVSITISGLSFTPAAVVIFTTASVPSYAGGLQFFVYDPAISVNCAIRSYNNTIYFHTGSVTFINGGFTANPGVVFNTSNVFYWYAIGAEG